MRNVGRLRPSVVIGGRGNTWTFLFGEAGHGRVVPDLARRPENRYPSPA